ncbi:MAG: TIGR00730 family Rossman fold protein [Phycisphaerales bacterium]|nr:TIGR00730 family Rossman fold protein [Phycisphaerales bacterium]
MKKKITVYCGSSPKALIPSHVEQTKQLATFMAKNKIGLVYGGSNIGLMQVISNTVLDNGGEVTGVYPHIFTKNNEHEFANPRLKVDNLILVDTMHQRKQIMSDLGDAYIALPGGVGTMEEFLEIITWYSLKIHSKPIWIFNMDGFYKPLFDLFDTMNKECRIKNWNPSMCVNTMQELEKNILDFYTSQSQNMSHLLKN